MLNRKATLHITHGVRRTLQEMLDHTSRSDGLVHTSAQPRTLSQPFTGYIEELPAAQIDHDATRDPTHHDVISVPNATASTSASLLAQFARRRLETPRPKAPERRTKHGKTTTRAKRTCMKCQHQDCPGSGNRSKCRGICADCQQPTCPGREKEYPKAKCLNARSRG